MVDRDRTPVPGEEAPDATHVEALPGGPPATASGVEEPAPLPPLDFDADEWAPQQTRVPTGDEPIWPRGAPGILPGRHSPGEFTSAPTRQAPPDDHLLEAAGREFLTPIVTAQTAPDAELLRAAAPPPDDGDYEDFAVEMPTMPGGTRPHGLGARVDTARPVPAKAEPAKPEPHAFATEDSDYEIEVLRRMTPEPRRRSGAMPAQGAPVAPAPAPAAPAPAAPAPAAPAPAAPAPAAPAPAVRARTEGEAAADEAMLALDRLERGEPAPIEPVVPAVRATPAVAEPARAPVATAPAPAVPEPAPAPAAATSATAAAAPDARRPRTGEHAAMQQRPARSPSTSPPPAARASRAPEEQVHAAPSVESLLAFDARTIVVRGEVSAEAADAQALGAATAGVRELLDQAIASEHRTGGSVRRAGLFGARAGLLAELAGAPEDAQARYEAARKADLDQHAALAGLYRVARVAGRADDAQALLAKWLPVAAAGERTALEAEHAALLDARGDAGAEAAWAALLDQSPDDLRARLALVRQALARGGDDALEALEGLGSRAGSSALEGAISLERARRLESAGRGDHAWRAFEQALGDLDRPPATPVARAAMEGLCRLDARGQRPFGARVRARPLGDDLAERCRAAMLALEAGDAMRGLVEIGELPDTPAAARAYLNKGELLVAREELEPAAAAFGRAAELFLDAQGAAEARVRQAELLARAGQRGRALAALDSALERAPAHVGATVLRTSLLEQGSPEEQLMALSSRGSSRALRDQAVVHMSLARLEDARRALSDALAQARAGRSGEDVPSPGEAGIVLDLAETGAGADGLAALAPVVVAAQRATVRELAGWSALEHGDLALAADLLGEAMQGFAPAARLAAAGLASGLAERRALLALEEQVDDPGIRAVVRFRLTCLAEPPLAAADEARCIAHEAAIAHPTHTPLAVRARLRDAADPTALAALEAATVEGLGGTTSSGEAREAAARALLLDGAPPTLLDALERARAGGDVAGQRRALVALSVEPSCPGWPEVLLGELAERAGDDADALSRYQRALGAPAMLAHASDAAMRVAFRRRDAETLSNLGLRRAAARPVDPSDPRSGPARARALHASALAGLVGLSDSARLSAEDAALAADPGDASALVALERAPRDREHLSELYGRLLDRLRDARGDALDPPLEEAVRAERKRLVERAGSAASLLPAVQEADTVDRLVERAQTESGAGRAAYLVSAALSLEQAGQGADARQRLREAVAADPDHLPALVLLALGALAEGDLAEGARWLAEAAPRHADHATSSEAWMVVGEIARFSLSDDARAIAAYRAALDATPTATEAFGALRELLRAHDRRAELAALLEAQSRREEDAEVGIALDLELAALQESLPGERASARRSLERAVTRDPRNPSALWALGEHCHAEGDFSAEQSALTRLVDTHADRVMLREAYLRLGLIAAGPLPDLPRAARWLGACLRVDPNYVKALEVLSTVLERLGDLRGALANASRLADLETTLAGRARRLLRCAEIAERGFGDLRGAEETLRRAVDDAPEDLEVVGALSTFYARRGDTMRQRVLLDRVAGLFRQRLAADPSDERVYRAIASLARYRSQPDLEQGAAAMLHALGRAADDELETLGRLGHRAPGAGAALGELAVAEQVFHPALPAAVRNLMAHLETPLARDFQENFEYLGVGRGDRAGRGSKALAAFERVAEILHPPEYQLYVSQARPYALFAAPGSPATVVVGAALVGGAEGVVRWSAGRTLWLLATRTALLARLEGKELARLIAGVVTMFVSDYTTSLLTMTEVADAKKRVQKILPRKLPPEIGGLALECASPMTFEDLPRAALHSANRAASLLSGAVGDGLFALSRASGEGTPLAEAVRVDPELGELCRFAVSPELVELRRLLTINVGG